MKKILLFGLALMANVLILAQPVKTQVSENVELMGVIARLADYAEYNSYFSEVDYGGLYTDGIDSFFADYKEHPVVEMMRQYQENFGVGYDAVASMGVNISLGSQGFTLADMNESFVESRWTDIDKQAFLTALTDFYQKTNFHQFFIAQKPLFETIITTIVLSSLNLIKHGFQHFLVHRLQKSL